MKIAQISTSWLRTPPSGYGGTEMIVSSLTEELVSLGHDVTLFATGDSLTQAKLWSWFDTPAPGYQLTDEIIHMVKAYESICQSDFNIVHNHTLYAGPAFLSTSKIPSITTCHHSKDLSYIRFQQAFCNVHKYVSIS